MKCISEFRYIARTALRGNWLTAAIVAFVASLLGGTVSSGGVSVSVGGENNSQANWLSYLEPQILVTVVKILFILLILAVIGLIVSIVAGGAAKLGYARYNLNLVDGNYASIGDLFSQFDRLVDGFIMNLLIAVYTFLWMLLFIIPGIVKSFSYAMTPYILSEHPEYSPSYAISLSKEMMVGNKFRLFCLNLSFLGWGLLAAIPAILAVAALFAGQIIFLPLILVSVILELFVIAYDEAATAAFYREVSGTEDQSDNIYWG